MFRTGEDTRGYFMLLEGLIERWGIPLALYGDRHAVFKHNARQPETAADATQFTRALQELGIRQIFARSPQAKGLVERMAETFQDRLLVTELRLADAWTIGQATAMLRDFLPRCNARFAVQPEHPEAACRPVSQDLCMLFNLNLHNRGKELSGFGMAPLLLWPQHSPGAESQAARDYHRDDNRRDQPSREPAGLFSDHWRKSGGRRPGFRRTGQRRYRWLRCVRGCRRGRRRRCRQVSRRWRWRYSGRRYGRWRNGCGGHGSRRSLGWRHRGWHDRLRIRRGRSLHYYFSRRRRRRCSCYAAPRRRRTAVAPPCWETARRSTTTYWLKLATFRR